MRRPIVFLLLSECFGILYGYYFGKKFSLAAGLVIGFAMLCFALRWYQKGREKRCLYALLCVSMFLFGLICIALWEGKNFALENQVGKAASFEGVVVKAEEKEYYNALTVDVKKTFSSNLGDGMYREEACAKGQDVQGRVLVKYKGEKSFELVGKKVFVQGMVEKVDGARNPGTFDYARYLKSKNIGVTVSVNKFRLEEKGIARPISFVLSLFKQKVINSLQKHLSSDAAGLAVGLLFGDKNYMDGEDYKLYQNMGIAHVLAVSGLHVGLLYRTVRKLFGDKKSLKVNIAVLCILFAYAALAGFSVSVVRASLMISLQILAFHLHREYDLVCVASAVAIIYISLNPYSIFDSGLQLSYVAVYTVGICFPWVDIKLKSLADKYRKDWIYDAGNLLLPGIVIQLTMMPLIAFHFLNFSFVSIFINPIAIFLAELILPIALLFSFTPIGILQVGEASIIQVLCSAFDGLLNICSKAPLSFMSAPAPPMGLMFVYYALFFFFFSEWRYILYRTKRYGAICACVCICIGFGAVFPWAAGLSGSVFPTSYRHINVAFLDVGQGDCIHVQVREGPFGNEFLADVLGKTRNYLIDGGGNYMSNVGEKVLQSYLLKNGVRKIDMAFVSHLDLDHCKGLIELSKVMEIDKIGFSDFSMGDDKSKYRPEMFETKEVVNLGAGDVIELGGGCNLKVLWPLRVGAENGSGDSSLDLDSGSDSNFNSMVCMLTLRDRKSFGKGLFGSGERKVLLMGDATKETETALMELYGEEVLSCDVLKLGHHGSAGSSSARFLKIASPKEAVVSCGAGNSYGHPAPAVVENLTKFGIIIRRTDTENAVVY